METWESQLAKLPPPPPPAPGSAAAAAAASAAAEEEEDATLRALSGRELDMRIGELGRQIEVKMQVGETG